MEIGCFYSNIISAVQEKGISEREALWIARDHGVTALDIDYSILEQTPPEKFVAFVEEFGMHISSVYASIVCNNETDELFAQTMKQVKIAMKNVLKAKSRMFMLVPKKPKNYQAKEHTKYIAGVRNMFREAVVYGKEIGLPVIFENISLNDSGYGSFDDVTFLLEQNPELGFAYDSGNFPLAGFDELEGVRKFIDRTVHVHLKDLKVVEYSNILRAGKYYDSPELGGGNLKLKEVMKFFKKQGYQGIIAVEINSGPDIFDRTVKSIEFLKMHI